MKIRILGFIAKLYCIGFIVNSLVEKGEITLLTTHFAYVLFVVGLVVIGRDMIVNFSSSRNSSKLLLAIFNVVAFVYLLLNEPKFSEDYYLWLPIAVLILVEFVLIVMMVSKKKALSR